MAAVFLPIVGASVVPMNFDPVLFMLSVALTTLIGFMLPIFSDPAVNRGNMTKAGAPADLVGMILNARLTFVVGPVVFG